MLCRLMSGAVCGLTWKSQARRIRQPLRLSQRVLRFARRAGGRALLFVTHEPSGEIRMRLLPEHASDAPRSWRLSGVLKRQDGAHLSIAAKSEKSSESRAGFGSLPKHSSFGSFAKRSVRNCCGALATLFGTRMVFATLTLPGSTSQAREALAKWSGKAIELLTHWIHSLDASALYTYVWEWQKSGALHVHLAIASQDVLVLRRMERGFKQYVHRMFVTLGRLAGVDMFARDGGGTWRGDLHVLRSRIETIRKSVKRYMAKYLSKAEAVQGAHCPSRWWGCSRVLRLHVRRLRRCSVFRGETLEQLQQRAQQVASALQLAKVRTYTYHALFQPHRRTWLAYPEDTQSEHVFEAMLLLLDNFIPSQDPLKQPVSINSALHRVTSYAGC